MANSGWDRDCESRLQIMGAPVVHAYCPSVFVVSCKFGLPEKMQRRTILTGSEAVPQGHEESDNITPRGALELWLLRDKNVDASGP